MRIQGYYGQFDAPYVEARVICKRLGIDDAVTFLIDLGASITIISPFDAGRLGVSYNQLKAVQRSVSGVGGRAKAYLMSGTQLIFRTQKGNFKANLNHLFVLKPASKTERLMPSLLGRDFLNQMALLVDKRKNLVLITDEDFTI